MQEVSTTIKISPGTHCRHHLANLIQVLANLICPQSAWFPPESCVNGATQHVTFRTALLRRFKDSLNQPLKISNAHYQTCPVITTL